MQKNILRTWRSSVSAVILHILKPLKLSFIMGSHAAFFSVTQSVAPVFGFFSTPATLAGFFGLRAILTFIMTGFSPLSCLLYHIPTFCGALYLNKRSKFAQISIPITCMLLFIGFYQAHQVSLYALYWMIPVIIAVLKIDSIFLRALGSTFTAHAVGTICWMVIHNPEPTFFMTLASIVWLERILFASMMALAYYGIHAVQGIFARMQDSSIRNIKTLTTDSCSA